MKPRILISRSETNAAQDYVSAMNGVGCISDSIYAPSVYEGYDGLILAGGGDMDPVLYGEELCGSTEIDRFRDDAELILCENFIKMGKPILGICRGHQVLNVYFGGTLTQHIEGHRASEGTCFHASETEENSIMRRLFGKTLTVNSIHHQVINAVGDGFLVTQRSADGTVEAIEHKSMPIIGVQWHPERMCLANKQGNSVDSMPLFEYFAALINKYQ